MLNVTRVTATTLFKKNGTVKGYQYTAHDTLTGEKEVIRIQATSLYENAFMWHADGANGSAARGTLASRFTLGKKPNCGSNYFKLVAAFKVVPEETTLPANN